MPLIPKPNIRTLPLDDGGLVLLSERAGKLYRCNATAAAMWTALAQHSGRLDTVTRSVAALYHADPERVRADLDGLIDRWRRAGLMTGES